MSELKAFDKWPVTEAVVTDPGLRDFITIESRVVPKTGGRYAGKRFHRSKVFIVERLINRLMVPGHRGKKHFKSSGHCTGMAHTNYNIVKRTFELIEQRTKQNPVKVLVTAVQNAAPREETVTIEYGGARYPKAVECSPQRRIDLALRNFVQSSYQKKFATKKTMVEALTEEIINAYNNSTGSTAVSKRLELERQADASR